LEAGTPGFEKEVETWGGKRKGRCASFLMGGVGGSSPGTGELLFGPKEGVAAIRRGTRGGFRRNGKARRRLGGRKRVAAGRENKRRRIWGMAQRPKEREKRSRSTQVKKKERNGQRRGEEEQRAFCIGRHSSFFEGEEVFGGVGGGFFVRGGGGCFGGEGGGGLGGGGFGARGFGCVCCLGGVFCVWWFGGDARGELPVL